jgi:hypothetical protein
VSRVIHQRFEEAVATLSALETRAVRYAADATNDGARDLASALYADEGAARPTAGLMLRIAKRETATLED